MISYNLLTNSDGTQRTNYPAGDYTTPLNLPAPTGVSLTDISFDRMTLNWSYPSSGTDATGFIIQMWQVGVSNSWTDIPAPNPLPELADRQAIQTGLTQNTQYKFRIAAINGTAQGSFIQAWIQ